MRTELLFTSLVAGYWFCFWLHSTYYSVRWAEGYHVLFKSVIAGGVLLVIARGMFWFWDGMDLAPFTGDKSIIEVVLASFSEKGSHYHGLFVLIVLLAFILPFLMNLVPWVWERWSKKEQTQHLFDNLECSSLIRRFFFRIMYFLFCTKDTAVWMSAEWRGDATDMAVLRALHNQDLVELVMQDRSYIGFVTGRTPAKAGNLIDIKLFPLARTYLSPKSERVYISHYEENKALIQSQSKHESDFDEKKEAAIVLFQMSSVRFIRRIHDEDIDNYSVKLVERPSQSRNYASNGKRDPSGYLS